MYEPWNTTFYFNTKIFNSIYVFCPVTFTHTLIALSFTLVLLQHFCFVTVEITSLHLLYNFFDPVETISFSKENYKQKSLALYPRIY